MAPDAYASKLQAQIDQYREVANIHDLPDIFHYWSNKHLRPRLNKVMGADSVTDFYALPFREALQNAGAERRLLSIGAGDCAVEIGVAKRLLELGEQNFTFICLEVSPHLLDRADAAIRAESLQSVLKTACVDINHWMPREQYAGVMANHSLHHFVELEKIFSAVRAALLDRGVFATSDMIGRNGHMRWPEVLEFVDAIWAFLPERYKFNRQLNRLEPNFVNWDCSGEGFEGVRAQDILPLLVQSFGFKAFLAFGGVVDVFVDRAFGHNYDPQAEFDKSFVDFLQLLTDRLIDCGAIKPTMMFAIMQKAPCEEIRHWRHWTPQFCIRAP